MTAPRPFPVYPKNPIKASGGCRIKIAGKAYYLGKHQSEESYREYERLRLAHAEKVSVLKLPTIDSRMTVDQLIAAWARENPRGEDDGEIVRVLRCCVPLARLFGATRADEFRANRLRAVQEAMIDGRWRTDEEKKKRFRHWRRGYINRSVRRIVQVFRWAESREIVPFGTAEHLKTVPLLTTRDRRIESAPKTEPADWQTQVEPCLPFLSPVIRSMLVVQFHAGMRPSEVIKMRRHEVDQNGPRGLWLYEPKHHKNEHRDQRLVKVLNKTAQVAIAPWLMCAEPEGYIFPPAKRRNGARRYTISGYYQAVRRAIQEAGVKPWHLYSIRYSAAHAAELVSGLVGASALLGHASLETTKTYTHKMLMGEAANAAEKLDEAYGNAKKIG